MQVCVKPNISFNPNDDIQKFPLKQETKDAAYFCSTFSSYNMHSPHFRRFYQHIYYKSQVRAQ